ncbi:ATPase ravA, partial [Vibrio parahaemolyticus EKP-028]
QRFKNLHQFFS